MGAGAMGVRAGTTSRGLASGRAGPRRLTTPTLKGSTAGAAARPARDREAARAAEKDAANEAAKEAKRAALEEKRAERAARRAERASGSPRATAATRRHDDELDEETDGQPDDTIVAVEVSVHDLGPAPTRSADVPRDDRGPSAGRLAPCPTRAPPLSPLP